jgi:hypothetical protein
MTSYLTQVYTETILHIYSRIDYLKSMLAQRKMGLLVYSPGHGTIALVTYVILNVECVGTCCQLLGNQNNTNLSRINYRGIDLFSDILTHIRDWQICASLDGTNEIGEYIRTGLDYEQFKRNFEYGLQYATNPRQMRIDFTLTLPGMFEIGAIQQESLHWGVELLAKVIFSFTPDIIMSPLALPRHLLHPWLDELIGECSNNTMRDLLLQLKTRPTFEEQWPEEYQAGLRKGKARVLKLEQIRTQSVTMTDILSQRKDILEWWMQIA